MPTSWLTPLRRRSLSPTNQEKSEPRVDPSLVEHGKGRWGPASEYLGQVDERWLPILKRVGRCQLKRQPDRFTTIVRAIIGQQISAKAAKSIHARLLTLQGRTYHNAEALQILGLAGIRSAGLSGVKAAYVLNLAESVISGQLRLSKIGRLPDDQIIAQLTQVKGIGRWTAEMFLVFALNRPDVWAVGDLGIRVGIRDFYDLDEVPGEKVCHELAEPWRPYRTIAMWYLWRLIDNPNNP